MQKYALLDYRAGIDLSRRDFLRKFGQLSLVASTLPTALQVEEREDEYAAGEVVLPFSYEAREDEYAAGEVTLPFSYSVSRSTAPKPEGLNFSRQPNPDNCQVFVRIGDEIWEFRSQWIIGIGTPARYKGPDIDHMTQVEDGKYPDGMTMCWFLGGMWYDESERKLYAPMHVEQDGPRRSDPVAVWGCLKIVLTTSTDKGKTWSYEGDIVTSETYYYPHDVFKFSGSCYCNGAADFGFYVDKRSGYFYIFPDKGWAMKGSGAVRWGVCAARCAITDKMARGKWEYFYKGKWAEPALGGKSSLVAPSHLWGVIYSTYLDKYVCMLQGDQDPPDQKNIDGVYIGVCSDLAKQDWVWGYCPEAMFGFMNLMNPEGTDVTRCDQTFRYYAYWNSSDFERLDVKLKRGQTVTTDLSPRYMFEAHPESSDTILGRKTRIVGAASTEMRYSGAWIDRANVVSYEGITKECSAASGSVEFAFEGSDVYWRAVRSPKSGKADVYVDGAFRKTVDCYSPRSTTCEQFMYIKAGLAPSAKHNIKIVVRGEKHLKSGGTAINHIAFEYSAESYKASAGFCSLMGKNNWYYQQRSGSAYSDLRFVHDDIHPEMCWFGDGNCKVGNNYQIPDSSAAVRKWVAPHGGVIRIEGRMAIDQFGGDGVSASIWQNGAKLWLARLITHGQPASHDVTVKVEQGDAICFMAEKDAVVKNVKPDSDKLTWDPVITYVRSVPGVWRPNRPSSQNLALGKYARSKELVSSYRPFDAVDGNMNTAFVIKADDKISSSDDWLAVDLDKTLIIDRYVLVSETQDSAYRPGRFTLQRSNDGFAWTDVASVANNLSDRVEQGVPVFRARYVRIYLPRGKPFAINEFELYYTGGKLLSPTSR